MEKADIIAGRSRSSWDKVEVEVSPQPHLTRTVPSRMNSGSVEGAPREPSAPERVDGKDKQEFRAYPYLLLAPAVIVSASRGLYPVIQDFELRFFDWKLGIR